LNTLFSAVALSPNVDPYHNGHQKRRHNSGVSLELLEESEVCNAVDVEDACFSWNLDTKEPALKHINVHIPQG